ncbi:MAG: efflux RND transporter periplasmic adaptor subunit [Verrucomicrobium sp.]|nr:efflux RND transporter periplasmic adaptor subunit [Verrucomicrobium sp.]
MWKWAVYAAFGAVLFGCEKEEKAAQGGGSRPPQEVVVVTLKPQRAAIMTDLPARANPYRVAEIRPQVNGIIQKRLFTEGAEVKANDQLYQIDPAPYQAAWDSAQASVARAEATLASATLLAERYKPLVSAYAVSKQDYDNAVAAQKQAEADVASGKASVETARINLVYTKVLSPITGITGRSSVTEGALVTANQSNTLVIVQQLDPIYIDAVQPSVTLLRLRREMAAGKLEKAGPNEARVKLVLEDGTEYDQPGRLEFSETTVDQGTGSVILRMVFPNPKHVLLPGMFVHAQVQEADDDHALLVPQQGVTHNVKGEPTALVVGQGNKVEQRVIQADRAMGDKWLITGGLNAGDRVIVEGLQKVAPGAVVNPTEAASQPAAK